MWPFGRRRPGAAWENVLHAANEFAAADELDTDAGLEGADRVGAMEGALEWLRRRHLAFRRPERADALGLEELRLEILSAVTGDPELEDYYKEAWSHPDRLATAPGVEATTTGVRHRRVAVMQIELMVRAFYVLQLQVFANAPENQGWMILFRSWGRSPRFNRIFREVVDTLPPEFAKFYDLYLQNLESFASLSKHLPIHHPWLTPATARGRGLYMDAGRVEAEVDVRSGAEGFTDHRGSERADQPFERPSDGGESGGGAPPAPNE
jgi:hypothetical protein